MEKLKQIKVNYVTRTGRKNQKIEEVTLTESRLIRFYCKYKKIELTDNLEIDGIIKVMLHSNKSKALKQLNDGIEINNIKYKYLLTTPSMMKKENSQTQEKCECLFIKEDELEFKEIFEKVDSLDKIKDIRLQEKVCINKDLVARSSLALSGGAYIDYKPNIIILPSTTFKAVPQNYYTYTEQKDGSFLFESKDGLEPEFDFADGCGFFSYKLERIIKNKLKVKHNIDFIGLRKSGLAVKGMCVKADLHKIFLDIWNREDNDNFERREDGFYTKDVYGEWKNISKADLVINTNMAKWWKNFKYLQTRDENKDIDIEIEEIINSSELLTEYKDLITGFEVTKINKEKLEDYILTNYQLIGNSAITPSEMEELSLETERLYERIKNADIDATRLYYKDLAREELEEISASTKVQKLLQINENTVKTHVVKSVTNRNILRAAHQVSGGRFYLKGNYKTCCICPITYCNFIMSADRKIVDTTGGLQAHQFYVPKEIGKRVINRNPQAVFSETHRIELVKNELLDKHFEHLSNEIIFFNQADSMASTCSGLDFDLDIVGVWDNDILYNAVIEPHDDRHFYNSYDGQKYEVPYSLENEFECILDSAGNFIGSIANITTKLSDKAQELGYLYKGNKLFYKELYQAWENDLAKRSDKDVLRKKQILKDIEDRKDRKLATSIREEKAELEVEIENLEEKLYDINTKVYEKFNKALEEKVDKGELIPIKSLDNETIRKHITEQFYSNKEVMYKALLMSQIAIDAPKTCKFPSEKQMKEFEVYKKKRYPSFMYYYRYSTNDKNESKLEWWQTKFTNSALNINAKRISETLIKEIRELKNLKDNTSNKKVMFDLFEDKVVENIECYKEVKDCYKYYNSMRKKYRGLKDQLNQVDIDCHDVIENLREKYTDKELGYALIKTNVTSRFLIEIAWNILENLLKDNDFETTAYVEDVKGNIEWKFKNYRKVKAKLRNKNLQLIEVVDKKKKVGQAILECKIAKIDDKILENKAIINITKGKKNNVELLSTKNEKIGFIYNNKATRKNPRETYELENGRLDDEIMNGREIKINILEDKGTYYKVAIEL